MKVESDWNQWEGTHPMLGTLHVIPSSSSGRAGSLHRFIQMDEAPSIERLHRAVGGPIKLIEGFDSILRGGEVEPCIAFCSADAASIYKTDFYRPNVWANLLWLQALVRSHAFSEAKTPNSLSGPVVILWGGYFIFEIARSPACSF
jgi:hypothetical protein